MSLLLLSFSASAANEGGSFHQNGKIWVVIGVVGIIFLGLVVYLALQDKKISKLEKEIKEKLK